MATNDTTIQRLDYRTADPDELVRLAKRLGSSACLRAYAFGERIWGPEGVVSVTRTPERHPELELASERILEACWAYQVDPFKVVEKMWASCKECGQPLSLRLVVPAFCKEMAEAVYKLEYSFDAIDERRRWRFDYKTGQGQRFLEGVVIQHEARLKMADGRPTDPEDIARAILEAEIKSSGNLYRWSELFHMSVFAKLPEQASKCLVPMVWEQRISPVDSEFYARMNIDFGVVSTLYEREILGYPAALGLPHSHKRGNG
jgi:hypothetical protein